MATKKIAGFEVDVDAEGFLTRPDQWNKDVAVEMAKAEGIDKLTDGHWQIIDFMRKDFQQKGAVPTVRRINKVGGIDIKELYALFPDGPAKKAAKISGLSKPQGCV